MDSEIKKGNVVRLKNSKRIVVVTSVYEGKFDGLVIHSDKQPDWIGHTDCWNVLVAEKIHESREEYELSKHGLKVGDTVIWKGTLNTGVVKGYRNGLVSWLKTGAKSYTLISPSALSKYYEPIKDTSLTTAETTHRESVFKILLISACIGLILRIILFIITGS